MYHCLPVVQYNQTATTVCIFPSTVSSAYDPECIIAQTVRARVCCR